MRYKVAYRITKHKTFLTILIGILVAYIMFNQPDVVMMIENIGEFRLIGAFVSGFFFSSAITTIPALTAIYFLSSNYPPILIALFGALGAMFADLFLYRYVVSGVVDEIEHDFKFIANLERYRTRRFYRTILPVIGGLIIASPFPDELGIALLGHKKMKPGMFVLYSFVFNFIGIFIVATLGSI